MKHMYAAIRRACFLIALDNGGVNRERSAKQIEREIGKFLDGHKYDQFLPDIDAYIAKLSKDELETLCCGEESEIETMCLTAPPFTNEFLNDYFDEVC